MSIYGVFPGPYFPVFGLNTEICRINFCIQSESGKMQTRKNSVFGHFLHMWRNMMDKINYLGFPVLSPWVDQWCNRCLEILQINSLNLLYTKQNKFFNCCLTFEIRFRMFSLCTENLWSLNEKPCFALKSEARNVPTKYCFPHSVRIW